MHDLQSIISRDVGRGSEALVNYCKDDLYRSAEALLALESGSVVLIVTGYVIPDADPPMAETDGPLGAVAIADMLHLVGYRPYLVTDPNCEAVVSAAAKRALAPTDVFSLPRATDFSVVSGIECSDVSALLYIERPGRGESGSCLSIRGCDVSALSVPLGELMKVCDPEITIGIGDGGNEVGFGKLESADILEHATIAPAAVSVEATTYLLVSAVSNWGGWALVAAMANLSSGLSQRARSVLDADLALSQLTAMIEVGAVDGFTRESCFAIDSIEWEEHRLVLEQIRGTLEQK